MSTETLDNKISISFDSGDLGGSVEYYTWLKINDQLKKIKLSDISPHFNNIEATDFFDNAHKSLGEGLDLTSVYDSSDGRVTYVYDLSSILKNGIITESKEFVIDFATMDDAISSYSNDIEIVEALLIPAVRDILSVDEVLVPRYYSTYNLNTSVSVNSNADLKSLYQEILIFEDGDVNASTYGQPYTKPDWSLIEQWFEEYHNVISIDDANANISIDENVASDPIITFSADVADLTTKDPHLWLNVNGETTSLTLHEFSIADMGQKNQGYADIFTFFDEYLVSDPFSAYDPDTGRISYDYNLSYALKGGVITDSENIVLEYATLDDVLGAIDALPTIEKNIWSDLGDSGSIGSQDKWGFINDLLMYGLDSYFSKQPDYQGWVDLVDINNNDNELGFDSIGNVEELKQYYENTLGLVSQYDGSSVSKPDWSVIEQFFNEQQSKISIDDGVATISSNASITSDPLITLSADVSELINENLFGLYLKANGQLLPRNIRDGNGFLNELNPSLGKEWSFSNFTLDDVAYNPDTGSVTSTYDISGMLLKELSLYSEDLLIEYTTLDELITNSYGSIADVIYHKVGTAVESILGIEPEYGQDLWSLDYNYSANNLSEVKDFYENVLEITNASKPEWSRIEEWFDDNLQLIKIEDGEATLSSNLISENEIPPYTNYSYSVLSGTSVADLVDEFLEGAGGNDFLIGDELADSISTGGGDDTVRAGGGDDIIEVSGSGNVTINTGDGSDQIIVKAGTLGSIDITTGGTNNSLMIESVPDLGNFSSFIVESDSQTIADFHGGWNGMDIFIRDQMILNDETGKWEVNDNAVTEVLIQSSITGKMLSYVFGSNFIEGDNLYSDAHGHGTVNTIFAGDGADTIHLLGGDQQADVTTVYGDSIDFATGESLDAYFGDVLELTWAREDVDIGLYSGDGALGDMHRITYRGDGGYSEEMVIFKDIETLIFDSEGEREVVKLTQGEQVTLDADYDNVSFTFNGDMITVMHSYTHTVIDSPARVVYRKNGAKDRTTPKSGYKKVTIPEVSHEETVTEEIWNGHKDDVAAFTFNAGISVNVIKAVDLDLNGNDQVYTSGFETHDIIYGTEGANVIDGKGGDDIILAGDGDDVIVGGDGDDVILGGDGDDTLVGDDADFDAAAFADALLEDDDIDPDSFVNNDAEPASEDGDAPSEDGPGDDVLIGGEGVDTIKTGEGDDIASTGDFDLDGDGDTDLDILNSELDKVTFEDEEHI